MKCEDIREQLLDLAGAPPTAEQKQHLDSCPPCAAKVAELRQTMSLLDEWKAPEPSAYFDSRLRARLRAEAEAPRGFLAWFKTPGVLRPLAAAALTLVIAAGVGLFNRTSPQQDKVSAQNQTVKASEGSAVSDLQALDKNEDVLANFDLLDEVASNNPPQVHQ